jgi:hypothetical protein
MNIVPSSRSPGKVSARYATVPSPACSAIPLLMLQAGQDTTMLDFPTVPVNPSRRPSDLLTLLLSCVHGADYQIDDPIGVSWRRQTAIYHGPQSTTPWPNLGFPCFCPNLGMRAAASQVLYSTWSASCSSRSTFRKDTMPLLHAILYINCQRMQISVNFPFGNSCPWPPEATTLPNLSPFLSGQ